jgi:hypothetical protein
MNQIRFILVVLLMSAALPCVAGEIVQRQGGATLTIRYDAEKPRLALSDLITVTLEVEGKKTLRVSAADRFPASFPWLLVELSRVERTPLEGDRVHWRLRYTFAPREPGKQSFAFPEVKLRESNDEKDDRSIAWSPVDFDVTTAIADPDRASVRGDASIEKLPDLPPPLFDWRWLPVAVSILLVLGLALVAVLLWRRRTAKTPAGLALYEWQRLVALGLPEQGRSERFITLLTLLVRQYLERQFLIPARRQTTPEFLRDLEQHSSLSAEEKQFLTSFLPRADAIKFAGTDMSAAECTQWAQAAREFIARRLNDSSESKI